ncbi:hypothetical protein [Microcoleus anatoxicus]|uniref:Uncharacterized protein n=1 Tax=Microcoleus anatoxicus PTRS2 TaxID=2705321 RepID=A0ABU8YWP4_9CYAN
MGDRNSCNYRSVWYLLRRAIALCFDGATATNVYLIFYPKPDIAKALSGKLELQEVSGV